MRSLCSAANGQMAHFCAVHFVLFVFACVVHSGAEFVSSIPDATRPLLRQIEALQSAQQSRQDVRRSCVASLQRCIRTCSRSFPSLSSRYIVFQAWNGLERSFLLRIEREEVRASSAAAKEKEGMHAPTVHCCNNDRSQFESRRSPFLCFVVQRANACVRSLWRPRTRRVSTHRRCRVQCRALPLPRAPWRRRSATRRLRAQRRRRRPPRRVQSSQAIVRQIVSASQR